MSILTSVALLGGIGAVGALVLKGVASKFAVNEDPRIDQVEGMLPGANCGGCGCKGCRDFAVQCIRRGSLDGLACPSVGTEGMVKIAKFLGYAPAEGVEGRVAVVRCAGTSKTRIRRHAVYEDPRVCTIMNFQAGDYECPAACLGGGECVDVCKFGAIRLNSYGLPEVDADACTGCGMCADTCPRHIIEIRPRGKRERRVWVACQNCLRGAETRRQCKVGCIGCGKCAKVCPFDAITVTNNLAYIDPQKCRACGKCIAECPVDAIQNTFGV